MLWIVFEFGCLWVCIVAAGCLLLWFGFTCLRLFVCFIWFDLVRFCFVDLIGWAVYLVYIVGFVVFRLFCGVGLWFVLTCCGVAY